MTTQLTSSLWSLQPRYIEDDSTEEWRAIEYRSVADPRSDQNIKIRIDDSNSYFLPSEATLAVDFRVKTTNALTDADLLCIPNGWALFDDAKLFVNEKLIHSTVNPQTIHHMVCSHMFSSDYARSVGDSQMFYPIEKKDSTTKVQRPPVMTAGQSVNTILRADYANIVDGTYWFPINDPSVPQQELLTVGAGGNGAQCQFSTTGQYRPNPDYDPVRMRAVQRLLDNKVSGVNEYACNVHLPLHEIWPVLKQVFGRVNRGSKIEVQLTQSRSNARTFYVPLTGTGAGATPAGLTLQIDRCSLWLPRLQPSLEASAVIEKQIATFKELREMYEKYDMYTTTGIAAATTENRIRLATQTSRIIRLYVGLQLDAQMSDLYRNSVQFESMNLEWIECRVNGVKYPTETYMVSNEATMNQGLIRMIRDVYRSNGKMGDYENGSVITYDGFAKGAQRVYMLDLTNMDQSPFKKSSVSDLEVRYKLSSTAPGVYSVYVVAVSEGELTSSLLNGKILPTQV